MDEHERESRAAALKERIYLTFAVLAVVLTLALHGHVSAGQAATTVIITAVGTLLAVFTADLISHIVLHARMFTTAELRHALGVSFGALIVVMLPLGFLGAAGLGWWETTTALNASAFVLVGSLVVIGWIAVRRVPLRWYQRLIALGAEALLGLLVVGLKLIAH